MPGKILITGVSGLIGGLAAGEFARDYAVAGVGRSPVGGVPYTRGDIAEIDQVRPAFDGVDTVIHLAASRGNQPFDVHYRANVIGTYNVLEAAREVGVRRVVMASTGAVIGGYEKEEPYRTLVSGRPGVTRPAEIEMITANHPPRPRSLYAVTKLWGEAIGRAYAESHGISVICIRVGKVEVGDSPTSARSAAVWCSHRDVLQMLRLSVEAPDSLRFETFFAVSDNPLNYRDWSHAHKVLGFTPADSADQRSADLQLEGRHGG